MTLFCFGFSYFVETKHSMIRMGAFFPSLNISSSECVYQPTYVYKNTFIVQLMVGFSVACLG